MAKQQKRGPAPAPRAAAAPQGNAVLLAVPFGLTAALFLLSLLPRVQTNVVLVRSFWGAVVTLLAWLAVLWLRGVRPSIVLAPPRPQHYVQAMCHMSVYTYWGWHWAPVPTTSGCWSRSSCSPTPSTCCSRGRAAAAYALGFGPLPIVFSTNLFLWFRDDWFYLQFLLVAAGFLGKEFVRWERDGKSVHIFNPSAFSLALFSVVLIATGTTSITWGPEIASTLSLAPYIYVFLFLVGLVVMYFFSITPVAASAAATLFGLSALYWALTGTPYFLDSEIPTAVFLGLHLLVTDPSTSPRTPLGRTIFGILYGLGVFGLYALLGAMGAPRSTTSCCACRS